MRPYLTTNEVGQIQNDVEYKKKSIGGSIIFKKVEYSYRGKTYLAELFRKNEIWCISPEEVKKVFSVLGAIFHYTGSHDGQYTGTILIENEIADVKLSVDLSDLHLPTNMNNKNVIYHRLQTMALCQQTGWMGFSADYYERTSEYPAWKKNLTREKYLNLYANYSDPEELHYFDLDSPEYIRIENILEVVPPHQKVLDVGCNSGYIGKALHQKDCDVFGVDINPQLVLRAKSRGIRAVEAWAEKLPFPNESFDVIILGYLLEHVLDPCIVLSEAKRVLKKNGLLVGSVPTEYGDWGQHNVPVHSEHLRFFTQKALEEALQKAGFSGVTIKTETFLGRDVADSYFFTGKKEDTQ